MRLQDANQRGVRHDNRYALRPHAAVQQLLDAPQGCPRLADRIWIRALLHGHRQTAPRFASPLEPLVNRVQALRDCLEFRVAQRVRPRFAHRVGRTAGQCHHRALGNASQHADRLEFGFGKRAVAVDDQVRTQLEGIRLQQCRSADAHVVQILQLELLEQARVLGKHPR